MNEDNLASITYDFQKRTATLVYLPDSEYDIAAIVEFVEDMTDGKAERIEIFNGEEHARSLSNKGVAWGGIAHRRANGL